MTRSCKSPAIQDRLDPSLPSGRRGCRSNLHHLRHRLRIDIGFDPLLTLQLTVPTGRRDCSRNESSKWVAGGALSDSPESGRAGGQPLRRRRLLSSGPSRSVPCNGTALVLQSLSVPAVVAPTSAPSSLYVFCQVGNERSDDVLFIPAFRVAYLRLILLPVLFGVSFPPAFSSVSRPALLILSFSSHLFPTVSFIDSFPLSPPSLPSTRRSAPLFLSSVSVLHFIDAQPHRGIHGFIQHATL